MTDSFTKEELNRLERLHAKYVAAVKAREKVFSTPPKLVQIDELSMAHAAMISAALEYADNCGKAFPHLFIMLRDLQERLDFQGRVKPWMDVCFGPEISADMTERNHRFLEEALELVQSTGCTADEAHQLVEYVFSRDVGDPPQEVGGVQVTLAALCLATGMDMAACGETELARIWTKVEKIREKHASKPKHSAMPQKWPDWKARTEAAEAEAENVRLRGRSFQLKSIETIHTPMGRMVCTTTEYVGKDGRTGIIDECHSIDKPAAPAKALGGENE